MFISLCKGFFFTNIVIASCQDDVTWRAMTSFSTLSDSEEIFLHYTVSRKFYPYKSWHIPSPVFKIADMFLVQSPQWCAAKWCSVVFVGLESPLAPFSYAEEGIWRVRRFISLSSQRIPAQQGVTSDVCMSANISQERWVIKNRGRASRTQTQLSRFISLTPKSIVKLSLDSAI